jgi:hypothetical protein
VKSGRLPKFRDNMLHPSSGWKPSVERRGTDVGRGLVGKVALRELVRLRRKVKTVPL